MLLTSYDTENILRVKDYLEVTCIQSSSIVRSSKIQFLTTIVKHENKYDTIDRKIPLKNHKYFFASTEEKLASVSFFADVWLSLLAEEQLLLVATDVRWPADSRSNSIFRAVISTAIFQSTNFIRIAPHFTFLTTIMIDIVFLINFRRRVAMHNAAMLERVVKRKSCIIYDYRIRRAIQRKG